MKPVTHRNAVFLAVALVAATLAGCADVHQNPGRVAVAAGRRLRSAVRGRQPQSATNVPF